MDQVIVKKAAAGFIALFNPSNPTLK